MIEDGIIAIDKPEGISSAAVVARVKKKLGLKKVGHTGTLDPFATGLMLCGINKGTRLSQFFLGSSKRYIAEVALGIETDTQDFTGNTIKKCDPAALTALPHETILEVIDKFLGPQMQHPPVYSALKHNGKPLYQLAREGHPVQKPPRKIEIYSIEVQQIQEMSESESLSTISVTMSVHCSSGTYIRSLAHDIGQRLGCGASLASLRRTETQGFSIDHAIALSKLEQMGQEEVFDRIIPMGETLPFMPAIYADDTLMDKVRFGRPFFLEKNPFSDSLLLTEPTSSTDAFVPSKVSQPSNLNRSRYMRVIDRCGQLAAIVQYDIDLDKYDYCCVFAN